MPTLIHLSDLHFGPAYVSHLGEIILEEIAALHPDVVVISGDFTLRARHKEYQAAREFLNRIHQPTLAIPGNHDQPLFAPIERLTRPLARYEKYIHPDADLLLTAGGLFILGLNDNRPILPGGFWSREQRAWLTQQLANSPRGAAKIVVTHHQLLWEGWRPAGFWYPSRMLESLARSGVELVLNGHTHVPHAVRTREGIVVARAGTATSSRTRHGAGNSYNLVTLDEEQISVFVRRYDAQADTFIATQAFAFPRPINLN
jgi:3',5'-cyclic AMP phosphodiesterase CpdA